MPEPKFVCDNAECLCNRCINRQWSENGWCACSLDPAEQECRPDDQQQPITNDYDCNYGFREAGGQCLVLTLCQHQRDDLGMIVERAVGNVVSFQVKCSNCGHLATSLLRTNGEDNA